MTTTSGSLCLTADEAIPAGTLEMFLELLRATHGAKLLRIKGIVKLAEMPETPGRRARRSACLPPASAASIAGRTMTIGQGLVFITRDLPERTVRELFDAFLGVAAPDRPDRAALTENP